ncbi:MAG: DPP IV N-terminal domain-containing protein [Planctomycetota bacterium]
MFARVLCLLLGVAAAAQEPSLQLLDANRITSGEFAVERFGPARWLDGAHYATLELAANAPADAPKVPELVRYEAVSGNRSVLVSAAMLWVAAEGRALEIENYTFSADGKRLLVFTDSERVWRTNTRGEFYVLPLDGSAEPRRLGGELPKSWLQFAKFSPDGTRVGYVCKNDLYVEDCVSGKQVRLTDSGSETIINGTFDWVYEEEFDCQDGFRWSPDGKHLAYWQLDCSGVGTFYMVDNLSERYAQVVPVQYPKAGTTNSSCRVGVIPADGGKTVWMQTPGDPREIYVPRMQWHPAGKELMLQWLPRAQNHLVVYGGDVANGNVRKVHEERDEAYVDVRRDFQWLYGGDKFFWTSDSAFYDGSGPRYRQCGMIEWDIRSRQVLLTHVALTKGFDVIAVEHADLERDQLLVSGSEARLGTDRFLYRIENRKRQRLGRLGAAQQEGEPGDAAAANDVLTGRWNDYQISADGSLAIHTGSSMGQAPVVDLVRLPTHERVRVLVENQALAERYQGLAKGTAGFFHLTTSDGNRLAYWLMMPPGSDADDASMKVPVVCHVYNEPWSQTVKDTWFLRHHLFHLWLTQKGYAVVSIDARGTPAPRGRDWRKALFQGIGVVSSHDWSQAMPKLLAKHGALDGERMAIWGWSGGGAMTLNMLFRYPELFACGMAVAPVTHISLYDTIYQERYCGDPRKFPEVYERCSPITYAKNLKADLLLVHGTADDNVHFQNSERLFDELVAQGKLFEYLAYPNRTHAIRERKNTSAHLYASLADFLRRRLPAKPLAR